MPYTSVPPLTGSPSSSGAWLSPGDGSASPPSVVGGSVESPPVVSVVSSGASVSAGAVVGSAAASVPSLITSVPLDAVASVASSSSSPPHAAATRLIAATTVNAFDRYLFRCTDPPEWCFMEGLPGPVSSRPDGRSPHRRGVAGSFVERSRGARRLVLVCVPRAVAGPAVLPVGGVPGGGGLGSEQRAEIDLLAVLRIEQGNGLRQTGGEVPLEELGVLRRAQRVVAREAVTVGAGRLERWHRGAALVADVRATWRERAARRRVEQVGRAPRDHAQPGVARVLDLRDRAQQGLGVRMAHLGEQHRGRGLLDDATGVHHGDLVRAPGDHAKVVRD